MWWQVLVSLLKHGNWYLLWSRLFLFTTEHSYLLLLFEPPWNKYIAASCCTPHQEGESKSNEASASCAVSVRKVASATSSCVFMHGFPSSTSIGSSHDHHSDQPAAIQWCQCFHTSRWSVTEDMECFNECRSVMFRWRRHLCAWEGPCVLCLVSQKGGCGWWGCCWDWWPFSTFCNRILLKLCWQFVTNHVLWHSNRA